MRTRALILAVMMGVGVARAAQTGFTYQGRLEQDGSPVSGSCDLRFRLFGQESGGTAIATTNVIPTAVDNGVFTVILDFGQNPFSGGDDRWLEIQAGCAGASLATLPGRQKLTPTPYALFAQQAPFSGLTGVPTIPGQNKVFQGSFSGSLDVPDSGGAIRRLNVPEAGTYVIVGKAFARSDNANVTFIYCNLTAGSDVDEVGAHIAKVLHTGGISAGSTMLPFALTHRFDSAGDVVLSCNDFSSTAAVKISYVQIIAIRVDGVAAGTLGP